MKKHSCSLTALFLTAIYLVIVMSPLAPLALRSPTIAHAVTGECLGDCNICGCSAEQRASHTCCCWKKKLQNEHEDEQELPDCCKKKQGGGKPVLSCGCPCGGSKLPALLSGEKYEQLPYRFSESIPAFHDGDLLSSYRKRLTVHQGDPPDPPPKIVCNS